MQAKATLLRLRFRLRSTVRAQLQKVQAKGDVPFACASGSAETGVESLLVRDYFAARDGGHGMVCVRRYAIANEAHAAVAEEKIAAADVDAAKPRRGIVGVRGRAAIRATLVVVEARQTEGAVHRFVEGIGLAAAQGGDPQASRRPSGPASATPSWRPGLATNFGR